MPVKAIGLQPHNLLTEPLLAAVLWRRWPTPARLWVQAPSKTAVVKAYRHLT